MYVASLPSEVHLTPLAPEALAQQNRSHGRARIAFALRAGRTALDSLYQQGCTRVLRPMTAPGASPQAVLVNTAGGITGGDSLHTDVRIGPQAGAVITSQAAEKIYRSAGGNAQVRTDLTVDDGAWLAWLPQETILFDGSRLARETHITVGKGARLLACEAIAFGRQARKEQMRSGLLHDTWRLHRDGKLVWADALRLEDDVAGLLARPATADGAVALATVLYVADEAAALLETARELTGCAHVTAAATTMGRVLLARFAADSLYALRQELVPFLGLFLEAADIPTCLPRAWSL
ncbi:MAG: urease accessory protein UreD [Alphaproteobacteria bacterium]|nr:urease accessory protein UreD [Alphaproteobacteria bacterium]